MTNTNRIGAGSLINQISGTAPTLVPTVGMGATQLCYTDRHAYTIIKVSDSGKTIVVQADTETRMDKRGMDECQSYLHTADPNGITHTVRLTKRRGWYSKTGGRFGLGYRSTYHDYSF